MCVYGLCHLDHAFGDELRQELIPATWLGAGLPLSLWFSCVLLFRILQYWLDHLGEPVSGTVIIELRPWLYSLLIALP